MLKKSAKFNDYMISNLTINLTMKCNMRCRYCYVFSEELDEIERQAVIKSDNLTKILASYADYAQRKNCNTIDVTWHGGEPLSMGRETYEQIMAIEKQIYNETKVFIRNRLQTNGTLINEDWCRFFKKNKFAIGVSLDGPKEYHDLNRYYSDYRSAYKDTIRGIELLQKNDIPFGILCVMTNSNSKDANSLYTFFKSLKVSAVDFIPSYLPENSQHLNINVNQWASFLVNLFDIWIKDLAYNIPYFNDIIMKQYLIDKNEDYHKVSLMCELTDRCGENPSITPDGALYFCECLIGLNHYYLGNVFQESLYDLLSRQETTTLLYEMNSYNESCYGCFIHEICEGGCLKHRLNSHSKTYCGGKDYFCYAKQTLISHIQQQLFHKEKKS